MRSVAIDDDPLFKKGQLGPLVFGGGSLKGQERRERFAECGWEILGLTYLSPKLWLILLGFPFIPCICFVRGPHHHMQPL